MIEGNFFFFCRKQVPLYDDGLVWPLLSCSRKCVEEQSSQVRSGAGGRECVDTSPPVPPGSASAGCPERTLGITACFRSWRDFVRPWGATLCGSCSHVRVFSQDVVFALGDTVINSARPGGIVFGTWTKCDIQILT